MVEIVEVSAGFSARVDTEETPRNASQKENIAIQGVVDIEYIRF